MAIASQVSSPVPGAATIGKDRVLSSLPLVERTTPNGKPSCKAQQEKHQDAQRSLKWNTPCKHPQLTNACHSCTTSMSWAHQGETPGHMKTHRTRQRRCIHQTCRTQHRQQLQSPRLTRACGTDYFAMTLHESVHKVISLQWLVFDTNASSRHDPSGAATVPLVRQRTLRKMRRDPLRW